VNVDLLLVRDYKKLYRQESSDTVGLMRIEQLNEMTADEIALTWCIVNKFEPTIAGIEMEPTLFTSIPNVVLQRKFDSAKSKIKPEQLNIFEELYQRLF
jgi:hypothetical protein